MAPQELADTGRVAIEESDIISDWARSSHDLADRSVGVHDGKQLVAYAELIGADRADTSVLASHRGCGIGTWLAHWRRQLRREVGSTAVGMPVPQGSPGDRLLKTLGFHVRWTGWVLTLSEGATIPQRDLPPGYTIRVAEPDDVRPAHDVLEDAFLDTARWPTSPWSWSRTRARRGTSTGPRSARTSATAAWPGHCRSTPSPPYDDSGTTTSELSTDCRTGALGLYERVRMVVDQVWVNRGITLT